jgi:hypothetical protein
MTRKQWADAIERGLVPMVPQDPPARLCRPRQAGPPAFHVHAPHSQVPLNECRSVAVFVQGLESTVLPAAHADNQVAIVSVTDHLETTRGTCAGPRHRSPGAARRTRQLRRHGPWESIRCIEVE